MWKLYIWDGKILPVDIQALSEYIFRILFNFSNWCFDFHYQAKRLIYNRNKNYFTKLSLPFHKTILLVLLLYQIMFPCPVRALLLLLGEILKKKKNKKIHSQVKITPKNKIIYLKKENKKETNFDLWYYFPCTISKSCVVFKDIVMIFL